MGPKKEIYYSTKFLSLAIFIIIFQLLIGSTFVQAQSGGVQQNNYTAFTLDNSQTPPNCGRNCHTATANGTDFLVDLAVSYLQTMPINTEQTLTITMTVNETIDEISSMLMNRTLPDKTGIWAEPVGIIITANNESGLTDNIFEDIGSLSYELNIIANDIGIKDLTLHIRGGLATPGNQDWELEYNLTINVTGPQETENLIHLHWVADPPSMCANCELHIDWSNDSLSQSVNYSLDGGPQIVICNFCTDTDVSLSSASAGEHNLIIITAELGNYSVTFIKRNSSYFETPFGIENITGDGSQMQTIIYLFFLSVAFLCALYALNKKDPSAMFVAAIFYALSAIESIAVTSLSAGVEYTYTYPYYVYLWFGFALVSVVLTIYFVLNMEGFSPE